MPNLPHQKWVLLSNKYNFFAQLLSLLKPNLASDTNLGTQSQPRLHLSRIAIAWPKAPLRYRSIENHYVRSFLVSKKIVVAVGREHSLTGAKALRGQG